LGNPETSAPSAGLTRPGEVRIIVQNGISCGIAVVSVLPTPLQPYAVAVGWLEFGAQAYAVIRDIRDDRLMLLLLDATRLVPASGCGELLLRRLKPGQLEAYERCAADRACEDAWIRSKTGIERFRAAPLSGVPANLNLNTKQGTLGIPAYSIGPGTAYIEIRSPVIKRTVKLKLGWNRSKLHVGRRLRPGPHRLMIRVRSGSRRQTILQMITVRRSRPRSVQR
jgi:hypothetical protein